MTQADSIKPYTMEEIDEMLLAAENDFANGDYVTNKEVMEYLSKVALSWADGTLDVVPESEA